MPKVKKLNIYYNDAHGERQIRYTANRWQWQDAVMGEQYITLDAQSDVPIPFSVGDYCIYRGEMFYLNYIPSETQNARPNKVGNGFIYENIKFDSCQEELSRCQMRDITPTTGIYIASLGTNYTGSTVFSLYCGETIKDGKTYTPVCALAAKMQANLDEMYRDKDGNPMWRIIVNTTTFHEEFGVQVYDTHTDEKVLTFSNNYVSEALAMVYNEFKLNYCVKGRTIYIGYELGDLTNYDPSNPTTAVDDDTKFSFGYGKGNPSKDKPNTGLFQLKKIANSSQMIITRLRAFGSKKNMPYRYYNKKYGLSQSLFPVNLMLPDTFQSPTGKSAGNATRRETLGSEILDVLGESNDSYIEKDNNAKASAEGVREGSAFWDGSDSELEEIFPTIEGTTYAELRSAGVPDQDGKTGALAFPGYDGDERIDEILDICPDTNIGNGINYDEATNMKYKAVEGKASLSHPTDETGSGAKFMKRKIAEFKEVSAGRYILTQTTQAVNICPILVSCTGTGNMKAHFNIIITVKPDDGSASTTKTLTTRDIAFKNIGKWYNGRWESVEYLDKIPFPTIDKTENLLEVKSSSTITIECQLKSESGNLPSTAPDGHPSYFGWVLSNNNGESLKETPNLDGYLILALEGVGDTYQETPFHVIVKDLGFDITASFYDGDEHVLVIKSGNCVSRQFTIGESIEKVEVSRPGGTKVKGYKIYLTSRDIDDTLNTFYPSTKDPIASGDRYVLLGIEMPDVFVKAAEIRLLKAACQYMKDNCTTKFTYQPYLDDIFIERDYDRNIERETPEKSIYWRLYAGLKFTFRNIPKFGELERIEKLSVMIQSITIREGEKYTPQIEITLNDDIQQSTLQKIQTSVNKISNLTSASISIKGSFSVGGNINGANGGTAVGGGVSAVLSNDLTATKTVGGVIVGDKFEKGTSLEDVIRQILSGTDKPAIVAPTLSWVNMPTIAEYGTAKADISAKATLNSATEVRAVFLSINQEQESDVTSKYNAGTGYITLPQTEVHETNTTYQLRCVFVYQGKDYPITISGTTRVVKPSFYGKFDGHKDSLTASEIKGMTKFLSSSQNFALSGGNTIAFAIPTGSHISVVNVTEDGFSADWSNWNSALTATSETSGVPLGAKIETYKVYLAYAEGGFGEVKGTINIS